MEARAKRLGMTNGGGGCGVYCGGVEFADACRTKCRLGGDCIEPARAMAPVRGGIAGGGPGGWPCRSLAVGDELQLLLSCDGCAWTRGGS